MKHGDIDNRLPPRLLVTFEGVLATLPELAQRRHDRAVPLPGRWTRAIDCFEPIEGASVTIWDWVWRRDVKVDAVTFLPDHLGEHVKGWIEGYGLPISNVVCLDSPQELSMRLAYMPDVAVVMHGITGSPAMYGSKGLYVDNPQTMRGIF